MKNQAEIYQALLDGKTIVDDYGTKVKLHEGIQVTCGDLKPAYYTFSNYKFWSIVEPSVTITASKLREALGSSGHSPLANDLIRKLGL